MHFLRQEILDAGGAREKKREIVHAAIVASTGPRPPLAVL
jgi:hypothetical protein